MKTSVETLVKVITGKIVIVIDKEVEILNQSLFINLVPKVWSGIFLSLKL